MKVRTAKIFNASQQELWPLLFNSKMDNNKPCYILFGLPKPIECRLADNEIGGVGNTRECVSDKGIIKQTILEWIPEKKLSFAMRETNIYFKHCVDSIVENFEINAVSKNKSIITRTTEFKLKPGRKIFSIPMWIGLKSIHRYVFGNWKRLSQSTSYHFFV